MTRSVVSTWLCIEPGDFLCQLAAAQSNCSRRHGFEFQGKSLSLCPSGTPADAHDPCVDGHICCSELCGEAHGPCVDSHLCCSELHGKHKDEPIATTSRISQRLFSDAFSYCHILHHIVLMSRAALASARPVPMPTGRMLSCKLASE